MSAIDRIIKYLGEIEEEVNKKKQLNEQLRQDYFPSKYDVKYNTRRVKCDAQLDVIKLMKVFLQHEKEKEAENGSRAAASSDRDTNTNTK